MKFKNIKTNYKGIEFKSRLEADTAYLLDFLELDWEYEPVSFLLEDSGVHYMPDFYIKEIDTWIEVRGYDNKKGNQQINEFSWAIMLGQVKGGQILEKGSSLNCKYVVIKPNDCKVYSTGLYEKGDDGYYLDYIEKELCVNGIRIARCPICSTIQFTSREGHEHSTKRKIGDKSCPKCCSCKNSIWGHEDFLVDDFSMKIHKLYPEIIIEKGKISIEQKGLSSETYTWNLKEYVKHNSQFKK